MDAHLRLAALTLIASVATASCGGGGAESSAQSSEQAQSVETTSMQVESVSPTPTAHSATVSASKASGSPTTSRVAPGAPVKSTVPAPAAIASLDSTMAQQVAAATATAQTNPNCTRSVLGDYYWEVGDVNGPLASGTVGSTVTATTPLSIDSASKWIYASYVAQYDGGAVPAAQVPYLNFTSGYSNFGNAGRCLQTDTVATCVARNNSTQNPATTGYFYYDSGHMEVHANTFMGQGPSVTTALNNSILTSVFNISSPSTLGYSSPLMAGAVYSSGSTYGTFLRRILSGTLAMKELLGTNKVCTNPFTCPTAKFSPMQTSGESWNYSLGHWVEDDPVVGDHAFSSAGLAGFYPWIDQTKTYYGVIARTVSLPGSFQGYVSAKCGRMIRQAFVTGVATTSTTPTPMQTPAPASTH